MDCGSGRTLNFELKFFISAIFKITLLKDRFILIIIFSHSHTILNCLNEYPKKLLSKFFYFLKNNESIPLTE